MYVFHKSVCGSFPSTMRDVACFHCQSVVNVTTAVTSSIYSKVKSKA